MGRIIAIDYGAKRCGIAVTDPLKMIASGLTTVDTAELFPFLERYFREEKVDRIVVGYPLSLDGSPTHATLPVEKLIKKLKKKFSGIETETEDERFTSKMAVEAMVASGMKKKQRRDKKTIDKMSATLILQSHLEK